MTFIIQRANERGTANHGWLQANFSFSFSDYHNPERMGFGPLRVLNDDIISSGGGFGMHPHENMEIISLILDGKISHEDSMGNVETVGVGEMQVMSAGSGIYHSESNKGDNPLNLLQIWIQPDVLDVKPSHVKIIRERPKDEWENIIPEKVSINQDAELHIGEFSKQQNKKITADEKGLFLFVIEGKVTVNDVELMRRDSVETTQDLDITITPGTQILLLKVPVKV